MHRFLGTGCKLACMGAMLCDVGGFWTEGRCILVSNLKGPTRLDQAQCDRWSVCEVLLHGRKIFAGAQVGCASDHSNVDMVKSFAEASPRGLGSLQPNPMETEQPQAHTCRAQSLSGEGHAGHKCAPHMHVVSHICSVLSLGGIRCAQKCRLPALQANARMTNSRLRKGGGLVGPDS